MEYQQRIRQSQAVLKALDNCIRTDIATRDGAAVETQLQERLRDPERVPPMKRAVLKEYIEFIDDEENPVDALIMAVICRIASLGIPDLHPIEGREGEPKVEDPASLAEHTASRILGALAVKSRLSERLNPLGLALVIREARTRAQEILGKNESLMRLIEHFEGNVERAVAWQIEKGLHKPHYETALHRFGAFCGETRGRYRREGGHHFTVTEVLPSGIFPLVAQRDASGPPTHELWGAWATVATPPHVASSVSALEKVLGALTMELDGARKAPDITKWAHNVKNFFMLCRALQSMGQLSEMDARVLAQMPHNLIVPNTDAVLNAIPEATQLHLHEGLVFYNFLEGLKRTLPRKARSLGVLNQDDRQKLKQYFNEAARRNGVSAAQQVQWDAFFARAEEVLFVAESRRRERASIPPPPPPHNGSKTTPEAVPVLPIRSLQDLVDLAKTHFGKREVNKRHTVDKETERLRKECEEAATLVPGEISGAVALRGEGRLGCPAIVRLFMSRPNPSGIIYPGNTISQGTFHVQIREQRYELPWELDASGALTFLINSQRHGEEAFRNPITQNFYIRMRHAVVQGLHDMLVREATKDRMGGQADGPEDTERHPRPSPIPLPGAPGKRRVIRPRRDHLHVAIVGESAPTPRFNPRIRQEAERVLRLMQKVHERQPLTGADLEGVMLYVPVAFTNAAGGEDHVYLPGEPIDLLRAMAEDPELTRTVRLCARAGIVRRAGYMPSEVGRIRYGSQREPKLEVEERLREVEKRGGVRLTRDVGQDTLVNLELGTDPSHPEVETVVLGSTEDVSRHKRGEPNGCLEIPVAQLLQWVEGPKEGVMPDIKGVKRSRHGGAVHLAARVAATQCAQYEQGVFPSVHEAAQGWTPPSTLGVSV